MNKIAVQIAGYNNARGFEKNIYCTDEDLAKQIENDEVVIKDYRYSLNVIAESEKFYSIGFSGNWVIYTKYIAYRWTTRKVLIGVSIFLDKKYRLQAKAKMREQLSSLMSHYIKIKDHELEGVVALRNDIFEPESPFELKEEREGRPVSNTQVDNKRKGCYQHDIENSEAKGSKKQSYEDFIDELFDKKYANEVKGFREIYLLSESTKFIKPLENLEKISAFNFPELPTRVKVVFREEGQTKDIIPRKVKMPHLTYGCMQVKKSDKDQYFGIDDLAYEVVNTGAVKAVDILKDFETNGEYVVYLKPILYDVNYTFKLNGEAFSDLMVTYRINGEEDCTNTDAKGQLSFKGQKYNVEIEILKVDDLKEVMLYSPQSLKFKAHEKDQIIRLESMVVEVEAPVIALELTEPLEPEEVPEKPLAPTNEVESDKVVLTLKTDALGEDLIWRDLKFVIKYRKTNKHNYYEISKASQKIDLKNLWFFLPFECEELKILIDKNVPYQIVGEGKDRVIPIDSLRRLEFKTTIALEKFGGGNSSSTPSISKGLDRVKKKIQQPKGDISNSGVRRVSIQFILAKGGRISNDDFDLGYQVIGEKEATSIRFYFNLKDLTARFQLPQGLRNYKLRLMPKSNKFRTRKLRFPVLSFQQEEVEARKGKFQVLVYEDGWEQKIPYAFDFKSFFLILGLLLVVASGAYFGAQALSNFNNRKSNDQLAKVKEELKDRFEHAHSSAEKELKKIEIVILRAKDTLNKKEELKSPESKQMLIGFKKTQTNSKVNLTNDSIVIRQMLDSLQRKKLNTQKPILNTKILELERFATQLDSIGEDISDRFEDYRESKENTISAQREENEKIKRRFGRLKRYIQGSIEVKKNNEEYLKELKKGKRKFLNAGVRERSYNNLVSLAEKRIKYQDYRFVILCTTGKVNCVNKPSADKFKNAKEVLKKWSTDQNALLTNQREEVSNFLKGQGLSSN